MLALAGDVSQRVSDAAPYTVTRSRVNACLYRRICAKVDAKPVGRGKHHFNGFVDELSRPWEVSARVACINSTTGTDRFASPPLVESAQLCDQNYEGTRE